MAKPILGYADTSLVTPQLQACTIFALIVNGLSIAIGAAIAIDCVGVARMWSESGGVDFTPAGLLLYGCIAFVVQTFVLLPITAMLLDKVKSPRQRKLVTWTGLVGLAICILSEAPAFTYMYLHPRVSRGGP